MYLHCTCPYAGKGYATTVDISKFLFVFLNYRIFSLRLD